MRDKIYLIAVLLGAGLLLYLGRSMLLETPVVTWGLTFAGTTAAGVMGMALYRVQQELRMSRHELARKQAELNFAYEVQQALFPRQFPRNRGLQFSGVCVPASGISGDYYDVLDLADGRVVFAIADISGKGISAAILMSNLHAVLRTLAHSGRTPAEVCSQLNRHLFDVADGTRFATMFYAEWSCRERRLRYINAGHNPPFYLSAGGTRRLEAGGTPLGMFYEMEYPVGELTLQPGDLIALYSDGVTEAGIDRDNDFGEARLEAVLTAHRNQPPVEIQRRVVEAVHDWAGQELEDDMTLLLVRATEAPEEGS
jgi:sigma-B regulation protein RsbU (phosphoserine phosphatase)